MALEASDLNDSAILAATKQNVDSTNRRQFVIALPSGRELTSEWLESDQVSKAVISWCEAVRGQVVADAAAAAGTARAAAKRRDMPDPDLVPGSVADQDHRAAEQFMGAGQGVGTTCPAGPVMDGLEYAEMMVKASAKELEDARNARQVAETRHEFAAKRAAVWLRIRDGLAAEEIDRRV